MPYFSADVQEDICNAIDRLHMAKHLLDKRNQFFPDDWTFYVRGSDSMDQSSFFIKALAYVLGGTYTHNDKVDSYENKYGETINLCLLEFPLLEQFYNLLQSVEDKERYEKQFDELFSNVITFESDWNPDNHFESHTDRKVILFEFSTTYYMRFAQPFENFLSFYEQLELLVQEMKGFKKERAEVWELNKCS